MYALIAAAEAAAEAVGDVVQGAADAAAQKSGGLPQLNTQDFAPQLIWLAITFGLLYLALSWFVLPKVGSVLSDRKAKIDGDLADAAKLKGETDKALADYEKALADARAKASGIAKDTRQKVGSETEAEKARVEADLASKLQAAEARISATKTKALESVNEIAAGTASAVVGRLIGQDVSAADVAAALKAIGK